MSYCAYTQYTTNITKITVMLQKDYRTIDTLYQNPYNYSYLLPNTLLQLRFLL